MKSFPGDYKRSSGFSLIELLVAVALVAILAAISMGAISKVRSHTDKLRCVANLREIGRAVLSYTVDHNGVYPGPAQGSQRTYTAPYFIEPNPPQNGGKITRQMMLIDHLAPYINIHVTPGTSYTPITVSPLFICPVGRTMVVKQGVSYEEGRHYNTSGNPGGSPFGY